MKKRDAVKHRREKSRVWFWVIFKTGLDGKLRIKEVNKKTEMT